MADLQLHDLHIEIARKIDADMHQRMAEVAVFLLQQIEIGYNSVFAGKSGSSGAASALDAEVKRAGKYFQVTFGISKSDGGYLKYLEFGERGTERAGKDFVDVGDNTRSKAPRVEHIMRWLDVANVPTPDYFKKRAERMLKISRRKKRPDKFDPSKPWYSTDPEEQFAFAIAQKIKRTGRPALRIIERTLKYHAQRIQRFLEGAA